MVAALLSPRYRGLLVPLVALGVLLFLAYAAPLIAPHDPVAMQIPERLRPPSLGHLLGQDEYGRDVLSRLLYGARVSLSVAIVASFLSGVVGVTLGLLGGYFRGVAELFTLRLADIILSFPPILLALLIVTLFGPGTATLTAVLSLLFAPGYARVTYGEVLSVRAQEYVEAERALGAGAPRIVLRTVLPNVLGPIIVQFSLTVAAAILIESGLSFLGLGVVPPDPSWGLMIRGARSYMSYAPMQLVWPCLALIITVLIFNSLCDAMRDLFDPRHLARISLLPPLSFREPEPRATGAAALARKDDLALVVDGLRTEIATPAGPIRAVDGVSLTLRQGETLAVVGESGSGKSMTGLSIMGLLPERTGRIAEGRILLKAKDGRWLDLTALDDRTLEAIRGEEVAMIFQEPMTSLNPVYTVGWQIAEAILQHRELNREATMRRAAELLARVGIPDPEQRARQYPHQLSGGMRQRVMIAMAIALHPTVLIADEPTTALDVTIQAQILEMLRALQIAPETSFSMIFITHNLGVVAEIADRVVVMYAGQVVEEADAETLLSEPRHPYTMGLLASVPQPATFGGEGGHKARLEAIPGTVPSPLERPSGCCFAPRCAYAIEACWAGVPDLLDLGRGHRARCIRAMEF